MWYSFHTPETSCLLRQNILLSTLLLNTLSLCFSLNMRDHVSHPDKTTGKFMLFSPYVCIVYSLIPTNVQFVGIRLYRRNYISVYLNVYIFG
jgi:hypothetical protein